MAYNGKYQYQKQKENFFRKVVNFMSPRQVLSLVVAVVVFMTLLFSAGSLFENVDADQIVCIQAPFSGQLTWHTSAGTKWQGFGKVTVYKKRDQYWFSAQPDQGTSADQSLRIRFNDGGHATISGGLSWELPLGEEHLTALHTKYGSQEAVEQQLIRTVVEKSVYMTGPHMSSTESYAGRRSELLQLIEDQTQNGIILTRTRQHVEKDQITGVDKTVTVVEVEKDEKTQSLRRATESPLKEFGLTTYNLTINQIKYEERVEQQIQQQQQSVMQVQIAIAEAKRAEQQALTTKKEGEAAAAKAEWDQKAIAAKAEQEALMQKNVAKTQAEKELEVAELATKAAEQKKLAEIALGEGESQRRKLVMEADGALEKKLEALVNINRAYADAIAKHQGPLVPSVVMGNSAGTAGGQVGTTQLLELLTAKAAKDLSVDLNTTADKK